MKIINPTLWYVSFKGLYPIQSTMLDYMQDTCNLIQAKLLIKGIIPTEQQVVMFWEAYSKSIGCSWAPATEARVDKEIDDYLNDPDEWWQRCPGHTKSIMEDKAQKMAQKPRSCWKVTPAVPSAKRMSLTEVRVVADDSWGPPIVLILDRNVDPMFFYLPSDVCQWCEESSVIDGMTFRVIATYHNSTKSRCEVIALKAEKVLE